MKEVGIYFNFLFHNFVYGKHLKTLYTLKCKIYLSAKGTHQNGDIPEHREKHHYSKVSNIIHV